MNEEQASALANAFAGYSVVLYLDDPGSFHDPTDGKYPRTSYEISQPVYAGTIDCLMYDDELVHLVLIDWSGISVNIPISRVAHFSLQVTSR